MNPTFVGRLEIFVSRSSGKGDLLHMPNPQVRRFLFPWFAFLQGKNAGDLCRISDGTQIEKRITVSVQDKQVRPTGIKP